ncbi:MAG TPA: hypothetical protein VIN40_00315 [Candidatus Tyrphobacter sp.]
MLTRITLAASALLALAAVPAGAVGQYRIVGEDLYRVGSIPVVTSISYSGAESLSILRAGKTLRFVAVADCVRTDAAGSSTEHARFVQELLPDGSFEDRIDDDPDFLTILNQPFAVRLDLATIRDLRELRGPVPFAAASPVGGGDLRGVLRPGPSGLLLGRRVVGVRFQAGGSVNGPLPENLSASINGHIHLDGTAYYDVQRALLLALDARLTIDGTLGQGHLPAAPVQIVYRRSIRSAG